MTQLSFTSLSDYDAKIAKFVKSQNLPNDFLKKCRLEVLEHVILSLNMLNQNDAKQITYLMWKHYEELTILLNQGIILKKIDLGFFKQYFANNPLTFHSIGAQYYDCVKFIGQTTDSQEVYDQCLNILESVMYDTYGIHTPCEIMYLMNYNFSSQIDTSRNKYKIRNKHSSIDKLHDFYKSTWSPNPGDEKQNERYKVDMQRAYLSILSSKTNNQMINVLGLVDQMIHSHYHVINNTKQLNHKLCSKINGLPIQQIEQVLLAINEVVLEKQDLEFNKIDNEKIIEKKMRFLSETDHQEMTNIGIEASIYVTDENYEKESLRRDTLIELYKRKLAHPDSQFSHNLIRDAVKNGKLWLVKFLIQQGVQTRNIPRYDCYNRSKTYLQQLDQILKEDYMMNDSLRSSRKVVRDYLIENNYIDNEI